MDWSAPKSVRQIGDTKGKTKIYVEDYVMSFARRLVRERKDTEIGGVLLGHRFYHAREKVFLVSGMVSVKDFHMRNSDTFSQEMWTGIYTDIKENFTDLDVVGWFYSNEKAKDSIPDSLLEIHRRNFSEGDRLLYVYEEDGSQDDFYLYENSGFQKQGGYYIYYEKNAEMRNYMMEETNRFVHIVEQEDDRVIRNIRGVIKENEEKKKEKEAEGKATFGLASLVLVLGLVLGAVALNNRNGFSELRDQISGLQAGLQEAIKGGKEGSKTDVETLGGGVVSKGAVSGQSADGVSQENASVDGISQENAAADGASQENAAADGTGRNNISGKGDSQALENVSPGGVSAMTNAVSGGGLSAK